MVRVLSLSEAKAHLSRLVADCEKDEEELVITRNGRPAAVLISADEYEGWRDKRDHAQPGSDEGNSTRAAAAREGPAVYF